MPKDWMARACAMAAMLALGACSAGEDTVATGATSGGAADAGGIVDLPSLKAATWAGETWIASVEGTGAGVEQAKAMEGTKAQFQTCVPDASGADGLAKVVSMALGDDCTLTRLANGEDPGTYKGTLTCKAGTVVLEGMINETMVGGLLVRTMKAPDGSGEVTFNINLTGKPGDACKG